MISLIFGAGASSGSGECYPHNPPLGNDLFDDLEKLDGPFSKLDNNQKEIFKKKGFEEGMASIEDDSTTINPLQKELAIYLSKFKIGDNNLYVKLFNNLKDVMEKINIITLNYDLLIEQSLIKNNFLIKYELEYRYGISLLKPHGSSNFLPDLGRNKVTGNVMKGKACYIDCNVINRVMDNKLIEEWCLNSNNSDLSPVLSMYNKEKRVVINSSLINRIKKMYDESVKKSSIIILIGIKYVEHDFHIWEPIKQSGAKIYIVSRSEPKEAIIWAKKNNLELKHISGSFNNSVEVISNLVLDS